MTTDTPLALNLKALRAGKSWSQEKAAKKIGIKRCTLGAYEEGRAEPPLQLFFTICRVYKVRKPWKLLEEIT